MEPLIGRLPMTGVTSADLRRVVQRLDEAIRARSAFYEEREGEGKPHKGRKPGLSAKFGQPHPPLPKTLLARQSGQALGQVLRNTKANRPTAQNQPEFSRSIGDPSGN